MPEVFSRKKIFVPPTLKHDHPSTNPYGAFLVRPKHTCLAILEEDEQVILILRQHPATLLPRFLVILLLVGVGMFFQSIVDISFLPPTFALGIEVLWFLFMFGLVFERVVSWYFNVIVITDERIIDIDFLHLVYKNITVTKLDNIEDVTYSVTGVIQSLFNFGNVLIQTAGAVVGMAPQQTMASIEIWSTPNPAKVVNVINDLMLQEEQEKLEGRAK